MSLLFSDIVVDGAPVSKPQLRAWAAAIEAACSGLNFKVQVFSTLAAATAATIPATVDSIMTLGRVSAMDGGGASYERASVSTLGGFQSADTQQWRISGRDITPEMFGAVGDGTTDATATFQTIATWLNTIGPSGVNLRFKPAASYKIWPNASGAPAALMALTSVSALVIDFRGAKFTTDNLFSPQGSPYAFLLSNCTGITINDPWYVQTGFVTPLDFTKGGNFIYLYDTAAPYCSNIVVNNARMTGGRIFFSADAASPATTIPAQTARNIVLDNFDLDSVAYGVNCIFSGDNLKAVGRVTNAVRSYFPYNVSNHEVDVTVDGGDAHDNCLLKVYAHPKAPFERNTLSNIKLTIRSRGDINGNSRSLCGLSINQYAANETVSGVADNGSGKVRLTVSSTANMTTGQVRYFNGLSGFTAINNTIQTITKIDSTHIDLTAVNYSAGYTSGGYVRVPAAIRNVEVVYDVSQDVGTSRQPPMMLTYKQDSAGATDTTAGSGYEIENVILSGTYRHADNSIPALDLFNNTGGSYSLGSWTGETIRNIVLRDLKIDGSAATVSIDATNISGNAAGTAGGLVFENVYSPSTVTWTVTKSERMRRVGNVNIESLPSIAVYTGTSGTIPGYVDSAIFNGSGTYTATLADPTICKGKRLRVKTIAAQAVNSASSNVAPLSSGTAGTAILAATAGKWSEMESDGIAWQTMAAA